MPKNVVKVDGDTVHLKPQSMEVLKIYWFNYQDEKYGAYKDLEGHITIMRESNE